MREAHAVSLCIEGAEGATEAGWPGLKGSGLLSGSAGCGVLRFAGP